MKIQNTTTPYKVIDYDGIQYSVCRDFNHISRYRCLRNVVHQPTKDRWIALETRNAFTSSADVTYHTVTAVEENRLDIIANNLLGSASYSWVISYFNGIEDGFTAREGTVLMVPKSISALFQSGELLASIPPTQLNLGTE